MGLPTFSIKRPVLTAMFFLAVMILGIISLMRLPVELQQGRSQGIVSIIIRARGGLPPTEVEKLITKPVEEAVATVSNLKRLYSNSREAESRVTLEFLPGTNMNFAALEVREKFSRVKPILPTEIEKPVLANYNDSDAAVLVFALTSESLSPEDIREMVTVELKPVLARVDGVASVEIYGGRERKILVELDRDKMVAYNISVNKVMDILGQSNINLLAGNVDRGTLEFAIRSMGAFIDVDEIGNLGMQATRQGSIIPLREIATVKDSFMEPQDEARLNLEQNVTVYVKKTSLSNTIPVVKNIRAVVDQFHEERKDKVDIVMVTDKAEIITKAINDVKSALYVGMLLAVALIYVFLRQTVLALIVFISIPASVVATFIFMAALKISINVMTLSGLALAIGILIDSSVVILENVFSKKEQGFSDVRAIKEGAEEVWLPLLASLITTIVVFLPIVLIDKKIQILYGGFSFTVVASLVASFLVAQMLVPMLMMQWCRGKLKVTKPVSEKSSLQNKIQEGYRWLMNLNIHFRYVAAIGTILIFAFGIYKIAHRDIDVPSTLEENEFSIVIFPLAGARLEANDDAVHKVEEVLSKIDDVELFSSTVRKDDVRVMVRLKEKSKRQYSKDEIMKLIDEKGNELVKETHDDYSLIVDEGASSSEDKKLVINIFGHENDVLQKLAMDFANRMGKVPGLTNVVMTDLRKRPEYSLVVDRGRAAVYGLSVKSIADAIHAQVRGMRPTKFHELTRGEEIEVITRLQAIYRQKIEDLKLIHIQTNAGKQIPLGEVANFYPSVGPQTIDRMNKYRYVFVKGDTKGALETVAKDVKQALAEVKMPDDYYWRFGGSYEELMQGKSGLTLALILTLFLVYMVMACMFQSYMQPFLIMISVPMASIGIWLGLEMTHKPLSNQVFIGMIILAGYVVNAAIILIDHMNHLTSHGMSKREALIQAGIDRLRPILMTTFSTTFGFLPMAMSWGQSSDLWSPLAITVIGGLLSSTFLTLFILPDFILITDELTALIKNSFLKAAAFVGGLFKIRFIKGT
ncbi:MAG: efflux RND transporter permease subunit [Candidatus Omnitrophica bacterium]|nr:efflux RND transporter permease subunit [Candidatus Omnitrophota bacterium]